MPPAAQHEPPALLGVCHCLCYLARRYCRERALKGASLGATLDQPLGPGDHLIGVERLGDEVVRPEPDSAHPVVRVADRRKEQNRQVRGREVGAQVGEHFPAGSPRHHDVEHDDIDVGVHNRLLDAIGALDGHDFVASALEGDLEEAQDVAVVVDQQNPCHLKEPTRRT